MQSSAAFHGMGKNAGKGLCATVELGHDDHTVPKGFRAGEAPVGGTIHHFQQQVSSLIKIHLAAHDRIHVHIDMFAHGTHSAGVGRDFDDRHDGIADDIALARGEEMHHSVGVTISASAVKILLLLVALIYVIAWMRAGVNPERVRTFLASKKRGFGYVLGAVTPFCSCSSVPLFLGFTSAGITMSFLITSPIINEVAVVLLWGLLGWKFTVIYVGTGIAAGILGVCLMDAIAAGRWLQPLVCYAMKTPLIPLTPSR